MSRLLAIAALFAVALPSPAAEPTAAERGYKSLTETAFIPAFWTAKAVPNAWQHWGVKAKPADYDAAFRERYGLHPAPYPNDGLPMGACFTGRFGDEATLLRLAAQLEQARPWKDTLPPVHARGPGH